MSRCPNFGCAAWDFRIYRSWSVPTCTVFPESFFARFGPRFMTRYYSTSLDGPLASALVAEVDGEVSGYLVGILDGPRHRGLPLPHHRAGLATAGVLGICRRPWLGWEFRLDPAAAVCTRAAQVSPTEHRGSTQSRKSGGPLTRGCGCGVPTAWRWHPTHHELPSAGRVRGLLTRLPAHASRRRRLLRSPSWGARGGVGIEPGWTHGAIPMRAASDFRTPCLACECRRDVVKAGGRRFRWHRHTEKFLAGLAVALITVLGAYAPKLAGMGESGGSGVEFNGKQDVGPEPARSNMSRPCSGPRCVRPGCCELSVR